MSLKKKKKNRKKVKGNHVNDIKGRLKSTSLHKIEN